MTVTVCHFASNSRSVLRCWFCLCLFPYLVPLAMLSSVASGSATQPASRAAPGDSEAAGGGFGSVFVSDARRVLGRFLIVAGTAVVAMLAGASFGLFQSLVGSLGMFRGHAVTQVSLSGGEWLAPAEPLLLRRVLLFPHSSCFSDDVEF